MRNKGAKGVKNITFKFIKIIKDLLKRTRKHEIYVC